MSTLNQNTYKEEEEEDEDEYNYFSTHHGCMRCHQKLSTEDLIYTEFEWDLRPRPKDYALGHPRCQDTLGLYLCHHCHLNCKVVKTIGWDKWDAIDVLSTIPKKMITSVRFISKL